MSTNAPMVECPVCGEEFQQDAYWEMSEGSDLECPRCGAELNVSEVETVMRWSVCTRAEYDVAKAKEEEWRAKQRERFLATRLPTPPAGRGE